MHVPQPSGNDGEAWQRPLAQISGLINGQSCTHSSVVREHTKPGAQGQALPSTPLPSGGSESAGTQLVVPSSFTTMQALS
jgi:hypothetical protein